MALFSKSSLPQIDLKRYPDSKALLKQGKAHCKRKEYDRAITCFSDGLRNVFAPHDVRKACFYALQNLADQGFAEAQVICAGEYFERGERTDVWVKDKNGKDVRAIINIRVVPHSLPIAIHYYTLAAEQGNTEALYMLPIALLEDVAWDAEDKRQKAFYWTMQAAERGSASAARDLVLFYYLGKGVPQDQEAAMRWLQIAVDRGDDIAQSWQKRLESRPDLFQSMLEFFYENALEPQRCL